jgi:hypothetical protein
MFITDRRRFLSRDRLIQLTPPNLISLMSIRILSSHLCLDRPTDWCISFRISYLKFLCPSLHSSSCYMHLLTHPLWFDHSCACFMKNDNHEVPIYVIFSSLSVDIATSSGLDAPGSIPGNARFFSSPRRPSGLWNPTKPPIEWMPVALSPGIKRQGREADHTSI